MYSHVHCKDPASPSASAEAVCEGLAQGPAVEVGGAAGRDREALANLCGLTGSLSSALLPILQPTPTPVLVPFQHLLLCLLHPGLAFGLEQWQQSPPEGRDRISLPDSPSAPPGAGIDGVEELKRHPFFITIDWNVSAIVGQEGRSQVETCLRTPALSSCG